MRKIAYVKDNTEIKRLMIYHCGDGAYLFEFDQKQDSSSINSYLQDSLDILYEIAAEDYGVEAGDWVEIDDPMEHCQYDRIEPVRVIGRETGKPQNGRLEQLVDGRWIPLDE